MHEITWTSASGRDSKTIRRTPKGHDVFSKMSPSESWLETIIIRESNKYNLVAATSAQLFQYRGAKLNAWEKKYPNRLSSHLRFLQNMTNWVINVRKNTNGFWKTCNLHNKTVIQHYSSFHWRENDNKETVSTERRECSILELYL